MNKKMIILSVSMLALAGCSSSDDALEMQMQMSKMDDLTNQVDQLSNRVSALSRQVSSLQSNVDKSGIAALAAQEEAERANKRIDNISYSYSK